jgi:hypothetical protein
MRRFWFFICLLTVIIATAQTYPDMGGAQVNAPFQLKVSGAVCFTGTGKLTGSAFFNFPTQNKQLVAFVIGPAAPGQEKNDEFTGPGTYSNINITLQPPEGDAISGFGQVVVQDDERSGTFSFKTKGGNEDDDDDDNKGGDASGTWDCGRKLKH